MTPSVSDLGNGNDTAAASDIVDDVDDAEGDVTIKPSDVDDEDEVSEDKEGEEEAVDEDEQELLADGETDGTGQYVKNQLRQASPHILPMRPAHSSHAPPPTPAAMRALLLVELKFAALRDRIYLERMDEAAAEESMVLDGTYMSFLLILRYSSSIA